MIIHLILFNIIHDPQKLMLAMMADGNGAVMMLAMKAMLAVHKK